MRSRREIRAFTPSLPLLALAVVVALASSMLAAPRFFIARFHHHLSPHLEDADRAFVVGDGLIRRLGPDLDPSTTCCSSDRHYVTTDRTDYLASDWTYEVTFETPAHAPEEVLFIGMGEGVPDPLFYNEPRNSFYFAIAQGTTGYALGWRLHAHDEGMWTSTYVAFGDHVGGPAGGSYTVRIRKVGAGATFEVLGSDAAVVVPDLVAAAPFLTTVPTRLFFGNAASNYAFTDMRVLQERRKPR